MLALLLALPILLFAIFLEIALGSRAADVYNKIMEDKKEDEKNEKEKK